MADDERTMTCGQNHTYADAADAADAGLQAIYKTPSEADADANVNALEEWDDERANVLEDDTWGRIQEKAKAAGVTEPHPRAAEVDARMEAAKEVRDWPGYVRAGRELEALYDPEPEPEQGGLFVEGELPLVPEKPRDRDRERERGWS